MSDLSSYGLVGFFFLAAIVFVAGGMLTAWFLRPSDHSGAKKDTYECGAEPIGGAWIQFHVGYYLIALVFVLFEVEVALLTPWVVIFRSQADPWPSLIAVGAFVGLLALADVDAWRTGALEWL